ncbi:MAG: MBOAT family protein [Planctomycetaceae bacterium]|nr:MBOAT family protein [Planctomycetaceae bacterium]
MLFNSFAFWIFFALVMLLYHRMKHRAQNVLLLVASYFFYGCWDWRFLGLIVLSTLVDYAVANGIHASDSQKRRRTLLTISMVTNLGILGFFKYYGFFANELDTLFTSVGIPALLPSFHVILPVGISFYTFQTMSYTIDVYRKNCQPAGNLLDFAVYVSFFPQLVAGPIERASHFLPQVTSHRIWKSEYFQQGLFLIVIGLFKKVVVADNMAVIVNSIFETPLQELTGPEVLVGVYAFAFQIYGDFSGYSSIARGVAKWLGFDLMVNFRMPYFAVDPSDFWRRWHISLSQWLRDYLYVPLGGNRGGTLMTYRNLMLTMLLGGLWHGANWTFIVWGAFHGLILCLYRVYSQWSKDRPQREPSIRFSSGTIRLAQTLVMFHLICISWLLFRADTMTQAWGMFSIVMTNFTFTPLVSTMAGMLLFCAGPLIAFEAWLEFRGKNFSLFDVHWSWRSFVYSHALMMCFCFPPPVAGTFIYFQF